MADALLTGPFTPQMAHDYGCAGRGAFDAFSASLGAPIDDADVAFAKWKRCVQCASNNDPAAVEAYTYSIDDNTCGQFNLNTFFSLFAFRSSIKLVLPL